MSERKTDPKLELNLETLLYSEKGPVAICVINRPDAMNALNKNVLNDLEKVLDHLETAFAIRCLILTGAGEKAFVAGADIKEIDGFIRFLQIICRTWTKSFHTT